MAPERRKSALAPQQRELVEEMQRIRFGSIEHLLIRHGLPEFDDSTRSLPDFRIKGINGPHPAIALGDTVLKDEAVALLDQFREMGSGVVRSLKIADGLPVSFTLEQRPGGRPPAAVAPSLLPARPPVGGVALAEMPWRR